MDEQLTYQTKAEEFADALFDGIYNRLSEGHLRIQQYSNEPLNRNIKEAKIKGSLLHLSLGGSSLQIALPDATIQSYESGALPLSTLANAVYKQIESAYQKSMNINESDNSQEKTNTIHL